MQFAKPRPHCIAVQGVATLRQFVEIQMLKSLCTYVIYINNNIGEYMTDKPIMRDPMDSEEAKEMQLRYKLMESIEYDFTDWECKKLYDLAMYDLLTSSECKIAIMLMAQKLGNIPIPEEDNE